MSKKKDRQEVAEELCQKDGHKFEDLSEQMQKAYLHNADEAIIDRERVTIVARPKSTVSPCPRCDGSGWIEGQPCRECNQVGLNPPSEENEKTEEEEKTKEKPEKKTGTKPDKIPENMFWCPHCNQLHRLDKAKGKKHFKKYIKKGK